MLGLLNFGAVPKVTGAGAQTMDMAKPAAMLAGGSFGALLAQVASGGAQAEAGADGKLTKLAAMLGKFRAEAQESLAEVFPDGVIVPGPELNDWAKSMLTKLDGMLQDIGATVADLAQVLAPMESLLGQDAGTTLTQAAQALLGDVAPGPKGTKAAPVAGSATTTGPVAAAPAAVPAPQGAAPAEGPLVPGDVPATTTTSGEVPAGILDATDTADMPETLREAVAALVQSNAAGTGTEGETGQGASNAAAQAVAAAAQAGEGGEMAGDLPTNAPLPDALRMLLAQVVAAPADKGLPPEIQTILSTPQANPAPLVTTVAVAAPAQAPQNAPAQNNGFARNLAGQIRGVSFSEGTTRIELTPQGLGKLEIEISPDEAGKLRVVIRAENPAVLNAMRSDRDMLAGLLRDGGTTVDDSAMSFEDLGQRRGTTGQEGASGSPSVSAAVTEEEDETSADTLTVARDGRLDILT